MADRRRVGFGPNAGRGPKLALLLGLILTFFPALGWSQHPAASPAWRQRFAEAKQAPNAGVQVAILSAGFLGLPYVKAPLVGSLTQAESLVTDLRRVDCFTLLDFVEALRRSDDLEQFDQQLLAVRYREGRLSYQSRNHFFFDWGLANQPQVRDATVEVAGTGAVTLTKTLNRQANGELWLQGLPVHPVTLHYLPTSALDPAILGRLQTGDYVGLVTLTPGLDVSHTGILIRRDGTLYLRHASSRPETGKVLDEPLLPYLQGKPGLVIFRPQ